MKSATASGEGPGTQAGSRCSGTFTALFPTGTDGVDRLDETGLAKSSRARGSGRLAHAVEFSKTGRASRVEGTPPDWRCSGRWVLIERAVNYSASCDRREELRGGSLKLRHRSGGGR